jgi:hypothetical protein
MPPLKKKMDGKLYSSGVYSQKFSILGYILSVIAGVLITQFEMYLYYFLDGEMEVGVSRMLEWENWNIGVFPFPIGVFIITVFVSLFATIAFLPTALLAFLVSRRINIKSNFQFACAAIIASSPVIILVSLTQSLVILQIIFILGWFLLPSAIAGIVYRYIVNMRNAQVAIVEKKPSRGKL